MIEPRNFDIWRADALIPAESNTGGIATVRCCLSLRGQRAFHVLHCDYPVNWGEPDVSCLFFSSMADNAETEDAKRISGSRIAS